MNLVDPSISLAFAVHSSPGVYALLLGSGVSRSASIPTGWEITLDLIRKVAHLHGEDGNSDPCAWYQKKFGKEPSYSDLLKSLARSPAERSHLLRSYFEPTEQERADSLKVPTAAHRKIAELVALGYVRVIVTTNFDRLLEQAISDVGISPTVIATPDAAKGAIPLTHTKCTIIKVHGDYLDSRIRNTPEELEKYDPRMVELLDRVFDEFGLIVCGWSADWDTALRDAIERCRNRRYTCFWALRSKAKGLAADLIGKVRAQVIMTADADHFFQKVVEQLDGLEAVSRPHPASPRLAVEALKKYIVEPRARIQLHDLVMAETERLGKALEEHGILDVQRSFDKDEFLRRAKQCEASSETMLALIAAGSYWASDDESGAKVWIKSLERLATQALDRSFSGSFYEAWLDLRAYPVLLLLYGGGMAAIAADKLHVLQRCFLSALVPDEDGKERIPIIGRISTPGVMDDRVGNLLPGMGRHYAPLSDHLFGLLREPLRPYFLDDKAYERAFDRFEYLYALTHAHAFKREWVPVGRFVWKSKHYRFNIMKEMDEEAQKMGMQWPVLRARFFDGTVENFQAARKIVADLAARLPWH